jgi:DNA modification methylase
VIFVGLADKFRWHKILKDNHFKLISEVIMVYGGGIKSPKRFLPAHESAMHYVLSKDYYFEEGELFPDVYKTQRPRGITRNWGYDYATAPSEKLNVTPKPLGLCQKLTEILCPKGGKTIDPFMGSGTIGEGCVIAGVDFTGYEIIGNIYDFAVRRIEEAKVSRKGKGEWW